MTIYRESAGSVAIASEAESTYGAGATVTHRLLCDPPDMAGTWDRFERSNLATGKEESTGGNVLRWTGTQSLGGPLCDKSLPILMSLCMGGGTRSAVDSTTASQHLIVPPGPSVELRSTQIEAHLYAEGVANGFKWYGVVPTSFTITGSNDSGEFTWAADFVTSGWPTRTVTESFSSLAQPVRCPWTYGKSFLKVATTLPTGAPSLSGVSLPTSSFDPTGGWTVTDWSAKVIGYQYNWSSGITRNYTGSTDGLASDAWRDKIVQTVTLTHLLDETNSISNLISGGHTINLAGEQLSYGMLFGNRQNELVGSTYYYSFSQYFPRVDLVSVTPARGNPRVFTSTWRVCNTTAFTGSTSYTYAYNPSTESSSYFVDGS